MKEFALAIPTYNAFSGSWKEVLESINAQNLKPAMKFIIDSSSRDDTVRESLKYGFSAEVIYKRDFNHGLTRRAAADKASGLDFIIYMTQDCVLKNESAFAELLAPFADESVAAAYGRQIPRVNSSLSEKVARAFNYPPVSMIKTAEDIPKLGISTAFCSDSFSAYRLKDMNEAGGFRKASFGEDMLLAARMVLAGKKIAYAAAAECFHSHPYSVSSEFKRGAAIGRMHKDNPWLLEAFGRAEGRGAALLSSVPVYLRPVLALQYMPKYAGYIAGKFSLLRF